MLKPTQSNTSNFELTTFLPYQLSVAANAVSAQIAKTYANYNLSRTQWRVMAVLSGKPDMSAQQVADKTGMDKTTVSRAVAKMLARGLVTRRASPQDARAGALSLSPQGQDLFAKIIPNALAQEQSLRDAFTTEELQMLYGFLQRLR